MCDRQDYEVKLISSAFSDSSVLHINISTSLSEQQGEEKQEREREIKTHNEQTDVLDVFNLT